MALVCDDIKSDNNPPIEEKPINEDLEDGEIEDDDDEEEVSLTQENEQKAADNDSPSSQLQQQLQQSPPPLQQQQQLSQKSNLNEKHGAHDKYVHERNRHERAERRKHEEKKKHLTEAEKSVMHLHKLERLEREKREKFKRESSEIDDFASNIEKAIANVLKKDKSLDQDIDEKRGKKRKKDKSRKRQLKKSKPDSPKSDEFDESEMLNMRGGSPEPFKFKDSRLSSDKSDDYESYDSEYSSERSAEDRKDRKIRDFRKNIRMRIRDRRDRKYRDRSREKKSEPPLRDGNICIYNIQGKCSKAEECPYNHDVALPMKLELCKFYLMGCCAKRDKCLYMHAEFPCKFYHTGITCFSGDDCKFAHGKPLSEPLRQILLKHIETAPKEILGEFPRLSRDSALTMIMQAQRNLEIKYGITEKKEINENANKNNIPSLFDINIPVPPELMQTENEKKEKTEKSQRSRPSRWQDADPEEDKAKLAALQLGLFQKDQDMRICSNGDIDMRTLPPQMTLQVNQPNLLLTQLQQLQQQIPQQAAIQQQIQQKLDLEQYKRDAGFLAPKDVDIRNQFDIQQGTANVKEMEPAKNVDPRGIYKDFDSRNEFKDVDSRSDYKDIDIRHYSSSMSNETEDDNNADEPALQIVMDDECDQKQEHDDDRNVQHDDATNNIPANLPKMQRDLYLRIQAQQKENTLEKQQKDASDNEESNVDWYSDDEDDQKLTIKMDDDKEMDNKPASPPQPQQIKPQEIVDKLGDLSKLDISAEVTKLLSSINNQNKELKSRDPRQAADKSVVNDPRIRRPSMEKKVEKISIYEQGLTSKDVDLREESDTDLRANYDTDLRSGSRPDVDLRQLNLPFKAIQNYTPASEIDASIHSHPPITWKVYIVDIPKPDYTGLKLNAQDPQVNGDPRLRKIFRLSTEEKDSPASPKQSPKANYGGSNTLSISSSGSTPTQRLDPRRRKAEENKVDTSNMTYAQQLTMLQSSPFYQSLTSNQKVMLNQELSQRADQTGNNDPILSSMLTNLGLISNTNPTSIGNAGALSILTNLNNLNPVGNMLNQNMLQQNSSLLAQGATSLLSQNQNLLHQNPNLLNTNPNMLNQNQNMPNMLGQNQNLLGQNQNVLNQNQNLLNQNQGGLIQNPGNNMMQQNLLSQTPNLMNQMAQSAGQPGLLGAAPGIPNLPPNFEINFDPRNGGLLGNAPYQNYPDNNSNFNNYNDEFYDGNNFNNNGNNNNSGSGGSGGGGAGGGGNNNNRNDNRGFRDNRNNNNNNNNNRRGGRNFNNRNNGNRNFRNRNRSNNRGHTPP